MRKTVISLSLLVCFVTLSGCSTTSDAPPTLGSDESFDGLREITNTRASRAWMRPGFDISQYTKVTIEGAGVEFRPVRAVSGTRARSGQREFPVTEAQQARLKETMREAFVNELSNSEVFELVDHEGPDVLVIWGGLLDVVSFVPPDTVGRSDIFLERVAEATLVIELRDSESNATLARVLDRRAASRAGGTVHSNPVTNWAEVRRLAQQWARMLRTRLEAAKTWDVPAS